MPDRPPPGFLRRLRRRLMVCWRRRMAARGGAAGARAEAALREREQTFRLAFASANTGMCLVSP